MTEEKIPPLPELEIDGMTRRYYDQPTVDKIIKEIYERRPDIFVRMAERDRTGIGSPDDEFMRDFNKFIWHELKIQSSVHVPQIFWEIRRRARLMYGMSIEY